MQSALFSNFCYFTGVLKLQPVLKNTHTYLLAKFKAKLLPSKTDIKLTGFLGFYFKDMYDQQKYII